MSVNFCSSNLPASWQKQARRIHASLPMTLSVKISQGFASQQTQRHMWCQSRLLLRKLGTGRASLKPCSFAQAFTAGRASHGQGHQNQQIHMQNAGAACCCDPQQPGLDAANVLILLKKSATLGRAPLCLHSGCCNALCLQRLTGYQSVCSLKPAACFSCNQILHLPLPPAHMLPLLAQNQ